MSVIDELTFEEIKDFYEEARKVRKAIRRYGGSFMTALGDAMDLADIYNLHKIRDTWQDDWSRYLEMAEKMEERNG
jgi:hypothetical protein